MDPDGEAIMAEEARQQATPGKPRDLIFNHRQKAKRINWKWGEGINCQSLIPIPQ